MATMTMDGALPRSAALRPRVRPQRVWTPQARPAAPKAHASTHGVHLTRRGRRVAFLASVLAAGVLAFLAMTLLHAAPVAALSAQGSGVQVSAAAGHSIVVHPGDTLWSIADREMPGIDPVEAVGRIREVNALAPSDSLVAGSVIAVPAV